MFFFVQKQGSNMRHTIEELEDKLTIASEKYEETEREVSLFWMMNCFSLQLCWRLSALSIPRESCCNDEDKMIKEMNQLSALEIKLLHNLFEKKNIAIY